MGTLRAIHRWLDALSERTKIVGLLGVIAVGLALVGGVALVDVREAESEAVQAAYDNGFRFAQSVNDGLSTREESLTTCALLLAAADASNQGVEATYTNEQADAFRRGCADGAPEAEAQTGVATESTPPPVEQAQTQPSGVRTADGAAVPANLAVAFSQGHVLGEQLAATGYPDEATFAKALTAFVRATMRSGHLALPRNYLPPGFEIKLQFDPTDPAQVNAFEMGALDAAGSYFRQQVAQTPNPELVTQEQPGERSELAFRAHYAGVPAGVIMYGPRGWSGTYGAPEYMKWYNENLALWRQGLTVDYPGPSLDEFAAMSRPRKQTAEQQRRQLLGRDQAQEPESEPRTTPPASGEIVLPVNWAHDDTFAARPKVISSGTSRWYDNLRWSGWGSRRAIGKGLEHSSDCMPSCANGTVSSTPVTIVASDPGECGGRTYYLSIGIEHRDGKAESMRVTSQFGSCGPIPD